MFIKKNRMPFSLCEVADQHLKHISLGVSRALVHHIIKGREAKMQNI